MATPTTTRPNEGIVRAKEVPAPKRSAAYLEKKARKKERRMHSGQWRPDDPFVNRHGIKLMMRREPGLTDPDVLKVPFRFQVPPLEEFRRRYGYPKTTFDTLRAGQGSRDGSQELLEFSLATLFMDEGNQEDTNFSVWTGAPFPQRLLNELRYIAEHNRVFRLIAYQPAVWGDAKLVNMTAQMTAIETVQKPGEVGVEYVSITFLEKRDFRIERRRRLREDEKPQTHRFHPGDTLYSIATHYYKAPSSWTIIAKANGIKHVSPRSSEALEDWMKAHKKKTLKIPAGPKVSDDRGRWKGHPDVIVK